MPATGGSPTRTQRLLLPRESTPAWRSQIGPGPCADGALLHDPDRPFSPCSPGGGHSCSPRECGPRVPCGQRRLPAQGPLCFCPDRQWEDPGLCHPRGAGEHEGPSLLAGWRAEASSAHTVALLAHRPCCSELCARFAPWLCCPLRSWPSRYEDPVPGVTPEFFHWRDSSGQVVTRPLAGEQSIQRLHRRHASACRPGHRAEVAGQGAGEPRPEDVGPAGRGPGEAGAGGHSPVGPWPQVPGSGAVRPRLSALLGRVDGFRCLADIVVATPGRLVDHVDQTPGFSLQHLRFLVGCPPTQGRPGPADASFTDRSPASSPAGHRRG